MAALRNWSLGYMVPDQNGDPYQFRVGAGLWMVAESSKDLEYLLDQLSSMLSYAGPEAIEPVGFFPKPVLMAAKDAALALLSDGSEKSAFRLLQIAFGDYFGPLKEEALGIAMEAGIYTLLKAKYFGLGANMPALSEEARRCITERENEHFAGKKGIMQALLKGPSSPPPSTLAVRRA